MNVNVLFISIGVRSPTPGSAFLDKYSYLSKCLKGSSITAAKGNVNLKTVQQNNFSYHFFQHFDGGLFKIKIIKTLINTMRLFLKSYNLLKADKSINVIIARTPFLTALVAIALGFVFKRKTLVEINGNFKSAFRYERVAGPTNVELLKEHFGSIIIKFVLKHVSGIKLLYPSQIDCYNLVMKKPIEFFHDFVPIKKITGLVPSDNKYILTLGYPWFLKGVDTLILAFKQLSPEFPQYKLKVHGWCPQDREYFEKLTGGLESIELGNPVEHSQAISLILNCSIFVLASRTEAMGRVLLEAMACRKPIIASNIGGIPTVVKDGFNGLLFTPGDVDALYRKMKDMLSKPNVTQQFAINGYNYVTEQLTEDLYAKKYKELLEKIINKHS